MKSTDASGNSLHTQASILIDEDGHQEGNFEIRMSKFETTSNFEFSNKAAASRHFEF